ncbi:endonuclease/exonuclease/phosphatase family protein [bacterium]|nr:endonuclease/exonuclease/phosphatase family protein [bacterium]
MKIRVGTFNLMNFIAPEKDFYNETPYTQEEFDKKTHWSLIQLEKMSCDFIGFQEIFDEEAFIKFVKSYKPMENATIMAPDANGKGPVVGFATTLKLLSKPEVISNFPLDSILSFNNQDIPINKFTRAVLKVNIELPNGLPCTIIISHLKSKRPMIQHGKSGGAFQYSLGKAKALLVRASESLALRSIIIDELKNSNKPLILIGDLNDSGDSVTSEIISGTEPWPDLPKEQKKKIWDTLLYNTYDIQLQNTTRDVFFSHIHNHKYETLDHIMVSQEFYIHNPNRVGKIEYLHFYNDHLIDSMLITPENPRIYSDHGQLVAQIKLKENRILS